MAVNLAQVREAVKHPRVVAFRAMIAKAEGTDKQGRGVGYNILVGGKTFSSYKWHPGLNVQYRPGKYSTAAGRYQFLSRTWEEVARAMKLQDFSPASQDIACTFLLARRGALADVLAGNFEAAVNQVRKEWASMPGAGYGQREENLAALRSFYDRMLATLGDVEETIAQNPGKSGVAGIIIIAAVIFVAAKL
ncbi:MAG: glycoside hydrolase family 24 protein [Pyrinomonadaceae bacterium]